ncbi:SdrD B-like domain-containing protein [Chryseobacterium wangxinyae]|uniref:SdrD B-like domain-containing protein n=1 Tax=Chryseobacterium sp. CY353 TaxID=2997334 RepID=UPI00226E3BDA|nr:SdrD B-like domain-containing protein [Chryseobacterium sp. CY353]MCY0969331.1 Ig-like domain-containing protein [Chryseobacterium sp. CY353]
MRKIFVLSGIIFSLSANAQRSVSKIYSDFNGFWESSSSVQPNNSHNLLGFVWDADGSGTVHSPVTYSTGVNDAALVSANVNFQTGTFISLPIYNIPPPGGSTFIGVGQNFGGNGNISPVPVHNNMVEYLSDGLNGLGLGSAIFNIPQGTSISLNTMGIVPASIGDGIPDLIFTQMGSPSAANDTFYFQDINGNMVGSMYSVAFTSVPSIGSACWKFYNANVTPPAYNLGVSVTSGCSRDIRVLAADWSEFGLTSANYGQAVKLIQSFSGTSDLAFIGAYNEESITFAASVAGTVYNDNNAGTPDGNGYSGATVKLYNNGTEIRTTTTNTAGFYFFDNINTNTYQGPYTVELVVPSGFTLVGNSNGTLTNSSSVVLANGTSMGNNFAINQPPVATSDVVSAHKNLNKVFSIISNDTDPNSGTLIPSSINLAPPSGAANISTVNGNIKGFSVSGQGTWIVDNNGIMTFTPVQNFFNTASVVNYTIRDNANLVSNLASITINVDYCMKPGLSGTPDGYTQMGISTQSSRYRNWPAGSTKAEGGIPNGFLALESLSKGMVISRIANTNLITNPRKGMIVYDIGSACTKLYNGTVWNCIKRTCND